MLCSFLSPYAQLPLEGQVGTFVCKVTVVQLRPLIPRLCFDDVGSSGLPMFAYATDLFRY